MSYLINIFLNASLNCNILFRLAILYHVVGKETDLQYQYFSEADSLYWKNDLIFDMDLSNHLWRYCNVMESNNEFDKIRRITKSIFEQQFSQGELINSYHY